MEIHTSTAPHHLHASERQIRVSTSPCSHQAVKDRLEEREGKGPEECRLSRKTHQPGPFPSAALGPLSFMILGSRSDCLCAPHQAVRRVLVEAPAKRRDAFDLPLPPCQLSTFAPEAPAIDAFRLDPLWSLAVRSRARAEQKFEKKVTLSVRIGRSGLLGPSSEIETFSPLPSPIDLLQTQFSSFFSTACPTSKRSVFRALRV